MRLSVAPARLRCFTDSRRTEGVERLTLPTGTVTFVFTDLEGSTRLWEDHPEAMQTALARHDAVLRSSVESQGGHVVKSTGDGIHAAFATAGTALRAVLDAQLGLLAEAWGPTGQLRMRAALHTGTAESRDGDYYGPAVNRAARLMSAAHGGQVVVSLATAQLIGDDAVPDGYRLVDLGEHQLRDLSRPERVFQLTGPGLPAEFPALRSFGAPGRDRAEAPLPVTVLFTDVEGSTALQFSRGDEVAHGVLQSCEAITRSQVDHFGGRIIKALGDGLMATFTSPRRAVSCALAINAEVTQHAQERPELAAVVRAGLHTGEVIETPDDIHGAVVSAASRICAHAEGGHVLVSDVVKQLCGPLPGVAFREAGRVALRGVGEQWQLFEAMPGEDVGAGAFTPFVGRRQEREELRGLVERTRAGAGSLVMIGGEPGVGKTRLAEQVALDARRLGFAVFTGQCYETASDLPYRPWVEILEALVRAVPTERLQEALGENAPVLAQLVPQIRRLCPGIEPAVELPGDQQRWYLLKSFKEFLAATARTRPHVLVVEDLHWADDSTLLLLESLVDWIEHVPILVLGTYRDTPVDRSDRLADSLAGLARRRTAHLLALAPHTETEVAELVQALAGDTPPPLVSSALFAQTAGNAFFIGELIRHFRETGRLVDPEGRFRVDLSIDELDVPANARLVIERRLQRLSEPTRRVLGLAAVVGRQFGIHVLEALEEGLGEELLDAVEEAERAHVIVEDRRGQPGDYRFAHELVRYTLLTMLSGPRRQRYHLRAADALERLCADDLERHASEIAVHLTRSGDGAQPARVARFLTMAGDQAMAAAAYEEARRGFEDALARLPSGMDRERADLLLRIGSARRSLREWDGAVAAWDEALTLLEQLGESEAVAELCWEFSRQLTWAYRFTEVSDVVERGLAAAAELSPVHRARLLMMKGIALCHAGITDEAEASVTEAKAIAEGGTDRALCGDVWAIETVFRYYLMQFEQTIAVGTKAAPELREAGALWTLADALAFLDVAVAFTGGFDQSLEIHEELLPLVERLGHWGAAAAARRNEFAVVAARNGDLDELEQLAEVQLTVARDVGNPGWLATSTTLRGIVDFWRGRWPQAHDNLAEGARLAGPFWFAPQHGVFIVFLAFCGEADEVARRLDDLHELFPTPGRANLLGSWNLAILAAEAAGVLGDAARARTLYPLVVEALRTGAVMRQLDGRLIETSAALAAGAAGLLDAGEAHFERALRQADEIPHVLERPAVRHFYGRFLIERGASGDRDRARALLDDAVAGYRAIGMHRHESLTHELLARI